MSEPKVDDLKIIAFNSYDDFSKYSAKKILDLYDEIESLKAITELAVKGLQRYGDMIVLDSEDHPHDVGMVAREILYEIERLQK